MDNLDRKQALALLSELVKIPSYIGELNPDSENLLTGYLENWIKANLKSYKVIKIPYGKGRTNLLCSSGNGGILFACHMDTVPTQSEGDLRLKVDGDKVFGLGTKDMKGGIVSLLLALKELGEKGLKSNVVIAFYGDEEYEQQGIGALVMASNKITKPSLIISPESRFNIGYGSRGICVIKLKITGKTAHSARAHLGIDAIKLFYLVYSTLINKLSGETKLGKTDITISELQGGLLIKGKLSSQTNMVPDYANGILSIRVADTNVDSKDIKKIIKNVINEKGGKVANLIVSVDHPGYLSSTKALTPVIEAIEKSKFSVEYADPSLAGYNDAALLASKLKVPLVSFGPYGENNHAPNEWVSLSSIIRTAKVYVTLMRDSS